MLTVLVPWGVHQYSSGTAQAVLDYARPGARLVFSCGWHITRDGQDVYSRRFLWDAAHRRLARAVIRVFDINDQVEACRRIFASDTRWTVVRGSDLEEGESQGLPVWSRQVGDPLLESNITRRVDFALFMVAGSENDELIHEAPAIVSCQSPSALALAELRNDSRITSPLPPLPSGERLGEGIANAEVVLEPFLRMAANCKRCPRGGDTAEITGSGARSELSSFIYLAIPRIRIGRLTLGT